TSISGSGLTGINGVASIFCATTLFTLATCDLEKPFRVTLTPRVVQIKPTTKMPIWTLGSSAIGWVTSQARTVATRPAALVIKLAFSWYHFCSAKRELMYEAAISLLIPGL